MPNVVIAGASGLVGGRVLHHLLQRADVDRVFALGRNRLPAPDARLVSQVVDLQQSAAVSAAIPEEVSVAFCCLGTTIAKAGSQAAFRAIDHEAVVSFAVAARARGAEHFALVSSLGANARSSNFYQRTKGEVEQALAELGYPRLTVLRPSLIDDEGARREYRRGERLGLPVARALFSLLGRTSRYAPITADVIAKAMVRLAFDDTMDRVRFVESDELHRLGS